MWLSDVDQIKKVGFFSVNIVAKLYEGDEDDDE